MKKIFLLAFCVILLFCLSACNSSQQNNSSSGLTQSENVSTLIRALTATDTASSIQNFEIIHEFDGVGTIITDNNDLEFLEKYTYSHEYPSDKLHELLLFPNNYIINLEVNSYKSTLYLMKDGSIAKRQMCGDSGVTDVPFEVYKADNQYMLNQERLIELLKKYNGYNEDYIK